MVVPLIVIFGFAAGASVGLARASSGRWVGLAGVLNILFAIHEFSFVLQPPGEWVRVDLLLILPLFTLGNCYLAWYAHRATPGWWVAGLAASAAAVPIWFFGFR